MGKQNTFFIRVDTNETRYMDRNVGLGTYSKNRDDINWGQLLAAKHLPRTRALTDT